MRIPMIEHQEPESFKENAPFSEIQARAWFMYLKSRIAMETGEYPTSLHVSDGDAIQWLNNAIQQSNETKLNGDADGVFFERKQFNRYVTKRTLQLVENVLPGTASVYFRGPSQSNLWPVLAGKDCDAAVARLLSLTGLTYGQIKNVEPEFFETLLSTYEGIAFHAIAATASLFFKGMQLQAKDFPEASRLLRQETWFKMYYSSYRDEPEISDIFYDSWYQKAMICLRHNSTMAQLQIYGLSREDILTTTGSPTAEKPGFKFKIASEIIDTIWISREATQDVSSRFAGLPTEDAELPLGKFAMRDYLRRPAI
jgi:hypothetical protein